MIPFRLMLILLAAAVCFAAPAPLRAEAGHQGKTVLLKNREYGEALIQGIREARGRVICAFYLFKIADSRGNQPRRIAEELIRAKRRGVEVTVILERDNGKKGDGLTEENRRTASFLGRGGVKVIFDSPSVVTHAKVAVIDGRHVYLGSHNLTQSALRRNNELSVVIDSPEMAAEVTAYLDNL